MAEKRKKASIIFLVNSGGFSGAETVNLKIIRNLQKKYSFFYASAAGSVSEYLEENKIKHIVIDKISVKTIRQIEYDYHPDIFHATDYKVSVVCALAHLKTPFISHLHSSSLWLDKIHPYTFAYLYAGLKAAKILTVSESIERNYLFSRFIQNKIKCISNPVCREDILNNCDVGSQKVYDICFTGRLSEEKDPLLFLKIVKNLKAQFSELTAVMVGDGDLRNIVEQKIKEDSMSDYVTLAGFQKNPYQIMVKAKIFLLPSKFEGYPLVAIEALTLGLPCVVADVGGLGMIVTKKCGFLCKNISEYENGLKNLLDNEKIYQEYSREAKIRAKELENNSEYMRKIDACYKEVLKEEFRNGK